MHCVDPACVSVCMLGALHKEGEGKRDSRRGKARASSSTTRRSASAAATARSAARSTSRKFEWSSALPLIVKCELCRHRGYAAKTGPLALANPACCEVCPREAVIFGKREELLAEAKRAPRRQPGAYNPQVYGETRAAGRRCCTSSPRVGFEQLGLPALPEESQRALLGARVSHAPYLHGVTPVALYAAWPASSGGTRRRKSPPTHGEEK